MQRGIKGNSLKPTILLTKITAAQSVVMFRDHRVRGLYFLPVILR